MSATVIQLRMVRGRLVATERAAANECEREVVDLIGEVHVRLVYSLASWDEDGLARGRWPRRNQ
jgi:hypothetical protein